MAFIRLVFRLSILQIKDKNKAEKFRNNKMEFILKINPRVSRCSIAFKLMFEGSGTGVNKMKNTTKNTNQLVSIIMPVYNASKYIEEAVDSVLSQTYTNWELIAVDDGSKDDSYKKLLSYSKNDKRIRVYRNTKNLGVGKTSNYAISKARGRFITRFDSDDIMPSFRIEKHVDFLNRHRDVILVGGQVETIDERGRKIGDKCFPTSSKEIYDGFFTFMTVQQGASMINASKLPHGFVWYNDNARTAEEVDLFFRLFKYGRFCNLSETTLFYRQYKGSTSLKDPKLTFFNTFNTRKLATKLYGYNPTIKAKLINIAQFVIVSMLPSYSIYPIFALLRGMVSIKMPSFATYSGTLSFSDRKAL
ncbi:MAG TPA: glycosyltransferase [bacterium]|nr:glycosyltransferase [bacterium]